MQPGSGFPLQVLSRITGLRAFRFNPSREMRGEKLVYFHPTEVATMYLEPSNVILPLVLSFFIGYFLIGRKNASKEAIRTSFGLFITAAILLTIVLVSDRVYIINEDLNKDEKWYIGWGNKFEFNDGTDAKIDFAKNAMVNNSAQFLNIKSVTYVKHEWTENRNEDVHLTVKPYSLFYFHEPISYWFQEPPEKITTKDRGEQQFTRYYVVAESR